MLGLILAHICQINVINTKREIYVYDIYYRKYRSIIQLKMERVLSTIEQTRQI